MPTTLVAACGCSGPPKNGAAAAADGPSQLNSIRPQMDHDEHANRLRGLVDDLARLVPISDAAGVAELLADNVRPRPPPPQVCGLCVCFQARRGL